jgi:hypothetical protein
VPHLIECLPTDEKLTKDQEVSTMCLLQALGRLTGKSTGMGRFGLEYGPKVRKQWQEWHTANKDYFYSPAEPKPSSWGWPNVLIDVEAMIAGQPTVAYRKNHPRVKFDEIKTWAPGAGDKRKLKDFCFSVLRDSLNRDAVRSLGSIHDPRALETLHWLAAKAEDVDDCYDVIWTLGERGDPTSKVVLEKIPGSKLADPARSNEARRKWAIERIDLLQRFGKELTGKPFDVEDQDIFLACLKDQAGVADLATKLGSERYERHLIRLIRVAGYVDRAPVRARLKAMVIDEMADDHLRAWLHGSLAQLGEKGSTDQLRKWLGHKEPAVRLAAAECLWRLGSHDGVKTLVDLLNLPPIETGQEGVEIGGKAIIKVTGLDRTNLDVVRAACSVLGEMKDRSAIEPLKRLGKENLNGILATGGSGTGWSGRPDVVALARFGDFSGIEILRKSITNGDRLGAAGSWCRSGDYVEIGLKRFIPDVIPLLDRHDASSRVYAAQTILRLLESGR